MMTSILSPVEGDYAIAIIQDMEMARGEAHGTDCLYLYLDSQVCAQPPVYRIPSRKLTKKDAMYERSLTMAGTVITLLKTIEGSTRQYRSHMLY